MYAIVDIETTGGFAESNSITEVAIVIHDGNEVVDMWESLINPQQPIPSYIAALTGINNQMVANAPTFDTLAPTIAALLEDKLFVAHNAHFDYSFIKYQLGQLGISFQTKPICTVRLARKIIPGQPSYSLGNLCRNIGIPITHRHRAGGDALATANLFTLLMQKGAAEVIKQWQKKSNGEHFLPSQLNREILNQLPHFSGVYFFHDKSGKIIYVGKAKNIQQRVLSHFTHFDPGAKRQAFLRQIHDITYEPTGSELMALFFESIEIKKRWPAYNRSQKKAVQAFGLYDYPDANGVMQLYVDKKQKHLQPIHTFFSVAEAQSVLRKIWQQHALCGRKCQLYTHEEDCKPPYCFGSYCKGNELPSAYNEKVISAIQQWRSGLPSYIIPLPGRTPAEQGFVWMEYGKLKGAGFAPEDFSMDSINGLEDYLIWRGDNEYLRSLVETERLKKGNVILYDPLAIGEKLPAP